MAGVRRPQARTERAGQDQPYPDGAEPALATAEAEIVTAPTPVLIVRVAGDIDASTVHVVNEPLPEVPAPPTIVDLSGVAFADCSLLNALLEARRARTLILAWPLSQGVRRLFDFTGATSVFTITRGVDAARRLLEDGAARAGHIAS